MGRKIDAELKQITDQLVAVNAELDRIQSRMDSMPKPLDPDAFWLLEDAGSANDERPRRLEWCLDDRERDAGPDEHGHDSTVREVKGQQRPGISPGTVRRLDHGRDGVSHRRCRGVGVEDPDVPAIVELHVHVHASPSSVAPTSLSASATSPTAPTAGAPEGIGAAEVPTASAAPSTGGIR